MDNYYNRAKSTFSRFSGAQAASIEAVSSQLPGRENGPADAYRHVLFAAELTRRFGEPVARRLLQSKETGDSLFGITSSDTAQAVEMDEHNNETGIDIGKNARSWAQVIKHAQKAIFDSPKDGRGGPGKAAWLNEKKWRKDPKNDLDPKSPAPLNWPNIDWGHGQKYGGSYDYPEGDAKYRYGETSRIEKDRYVAPNGVPRGEGPDGQDDAAPENNSLEVSEVPEGAGSSVEMVRNGAGENVETDPADAVSDVARARAMAIVASGKDGKGVAEVGNALDDLMLKKVDDLTEVEAKALGHWAWQLPSSDPRRSKIEDRRRAFYVLNYGDEPARTDETGRMAEPEPVRALPETPKGLAAPNGEPVASALQRVAGTLARPLRDDGAVNVTKALQAGLSQLGETLKVDGISGPRTKAALKRTVARHGAGRAEEAFAVGRFKRFAETERNAGGSASGLKDMIERDVQPLFGNAEPAVAAEALQESINALDAGTAGERQDPNPEPLKVDGDIGPRTMDAFRGALARNGPEQLTKSYASMLGLGV